MQLIEAGTTTSLIWQKPAILDGFRMAVNMYVMNEAGKKKKLGVLDMARKEYEAVEDTRVL